MTVVRVASTLAEHPGLRDAGGSISPTAGSVLTVLGPLGSGGFGTVSSCSWAGSGDGQVIKTFEGGGNANAAALVLLLAALVAAGEPASPGNAVGIPWWVGTVKLPTGATVPASIGLDLSEAGYMQLDAVLDDPAAAAAHRQAPLAARVQLARSLASCYQPLDRVGFVHADINAENVFIDLIRMRAAFIDYDSGALLRSGGKPPLTAGKADEFLAPELIGPDGRPDALRVSPLSERWAFGFAISYLLWGAHPLFFLRNTGPDTLREYAANHTWPDLPASDPLFLSSNAAFYRSWLLTVADLPSGAIDCFRRLVGPGIDDPAVRPSAIDWLDALLEKAPTIDLISVDSPCVEPGEPVVLTWSASGVSTVDIETLGSFPARGATTYIPTTTGQLTITATNSMGTVRTGTPRVLVINPPLRPQIAPIPLTIRAPLPAVRYCTASQATHRVVLDPARVRDTHIHVARTRIAAPRFRLAVRRPS